MKMAYNQITSQSVERLAALSDGIFAVAMTLLVLELHGPAKESIHSEGDLWKALVGAVLCVVNDYASIGFIVLAQLNFALAPRIPLLSKI